MKCSLVQPPMSAAQQVSGEGKTDRQMERQTDRKTDRQTDG